MSGIQSQPAPADAAGAAELLTRVVNRVGVLTLNRPRTLNALTHAMVQAMARQIEAWRDDSEIVAVLLNGAGERGFCAGGDVREVYELRRANDLRWREFFVDEYRLDYAIHRFPKPVVTLMDGLVMGGGMGLGQGSTLRITTERTRMAMPETRIGMVPDVGASYFLARLPTALGQYLGLSGMPLGGMDAVLAGLADVCVDSTALLGWEAALEAIEWHDEDVFGILHKLRKAIASKPLSIESASLLKTLPVINRSFGAGLGVNDIRAALALELAGEHADWARTTLELLDTHSPLMLEVTHQAIARGRGLDLADCFRQELCIVIEAIENGDFFEGVRARLIDKDDQPRWQHASGVAVTAADVARFFMPPWHAGDGPFGDPLRDL